MGYSIKNNPILSNKVAFGAATKHEQSKYEHGLDTYDLLLRNNRRLWSTSKASITVNKLVCELRNLTVGAKAHSQVITLSLWVQRRFLHFGRNDVGGFE